jgi:hypothetical protein
MELLFAGDFKEVSEEFLNIQNSRYKLLDSRKLFVSLMGYIKSERDLANGRRTGSLGSKRKTQIDKYGFSPKNFSHLFRLAYCGARFFETSVYPLDLRENPEFRDFVFSVKTEPERHDKDELNLAADEAVSVLEESFNRRKDDFEFDLDCANRICLESYMPFLRDAWS